MSFLANVVSGRRSKFAVLALAVAFAGALASQAGRADTSSDPAELLPAGAESLQALEAVERFPSGDVTTAVIVAARSGGVTGADIDRLERLRREIDSAQLPAAGSTSTPRRVGGGDAAVLVTPFSGASEDALVEAVQALRERADAAAVDGLEIAVTGGAGFVADVSDVFGGINGTLLIGAATLVLVLLILIYRSPIFWLIPFVTVLFAEGAQRGAQFFLGEAGFAITGQAAGIASVLTFGAATDYALLLIARYREELGRESDTHRAMREALRSAGPAIVASALTVALALLTLLLADIGSTRALGPLAASGVLLAMVLSVTLLPATLLVAGRRVFWPRVPRPDATAPDSLRGWWGRLADRVRRRPRRVWGSGAMALVVMALGLTQIDLGVAEAEQFATAVEAVRGQEMLAAAGAQAGGNPLQIVVPDPERADAVASAVRPVEPVREVASPERGQPGVLLGVSLDVDPFGAEAIAAVPAVRRAARAAGGADVLVGGSLAEDYDTRAAAERDNATVVPAALVVVLVILIVLLRALVLPLLLIVTVVASFAAALGVGVVVAQGLLGFAGIEATLPLLAFVFLVALGVDYNIFLVARARQETLVAGTGEGMRRALAATGGVITSAGIVLAGTFSILTLIPFVALVELGVVVAFGVLLDTLLVRSLIVPALVWDVGPPVWWPSRLTRRQPARTRRA